MELDELVQRTIFFFEDFANPDGRSKYKVLIDKLAKEGNEEVGISLKELLNDMSIYDQQLAQAARQMKEDLIEIVGIYMELRSQLVKGEVPGVKLKNDTVFITQQYIDSSKAKEKPTLEELAQFFMGYVTEFDGEQVLVTRFWRYAYAQIMYNLIREGKMQVEEAGEPDKDVEDEEE